MDEQKTIHDTIIKNIECPICYQTAQMPLMTCKNGHVVCNNCTESMLDARYSEIICPVCRDDTITRNLPLENIIKVSVADSPIFVCRYKDLGCREMLKYSELSEHCNSCVFNTEIYKCPFNKSKNKFNKYSIVSHIIDTLITTGDATVSLNIIPISNDGTAPDYEPVISSHMSTFLTDEWTYKKIKLDVPDSFINISTHNPDDTCDSEDDTKNVTCYNLHFTEWEPNEFTTITVYPPTNITQTQINMNTTLIDEPEDGYNKYCNIVYLLIDTRQIYLVHFTPSTNPLTLKYTTVYLNKYIKPADNILFGIKILINNIGTVGNTPVANSSPGNTPVANSSPGNTPVANSSPGNTPSTTSSNGIYTNSASSSNKQHTNRKYIKHSIIVNQEFSKVAPFDNAGDGFFKFNNLINLRAISSITSINALKTITWRAIYH